MKKRILFVIDSLHCAGAEKSLTTLLNLLDYNEYEVDLQLFGYGGVFESILPSEVNLLSPLPYTNFTNFSLREALKSKKLKMLFSRISYSLKVHKGKSKNSTKARYFWQSTSNVIDSNPSTYDIAIAYAQGIPTFYVADKVQAKVKYAWVNVSYHLKGKDKIFQQSIYEKYNRIIAVSDSTKEIFETVYPQFSSKLKVIYDINDPQLINKMANFEEGYHDRFEGLTLLTIGRLDNQKGYDLAIDACKYLKDKGIQFRWSVLGVGPLEEDVKDLIKVNHLENDFVLLGVTANPYPYIKDCDIYVQTSRFEGFGLAIAEARMLNKPVVTTRFDAVYNQMIHEKNGLVVDMNGKAVAEGILRLINDEQLRSNIISYLKNEKKGNIEELDKIYELLASEE